jgi:hypothetical protein
MPTKRRSMRHLLLPQFVEPVAGSWTVTEVDIGQSSVDTTHREARVPNAYTPAQRLARLHELGHVKHSPSPFQPEGDWGMVFRTVTNRCMDKGVTPLPHAVVKISKMLEENRIDWTLWDRYGIDVRPAREVLDWSLLPDPSDVLQALGDCLQLAWTVWASRGLGAGIPNMPPARTPDAETGEFFDKGWKYLCDENRELAMSMIKGCLAMYREPTDERRNQVAAELAMFFPIPEEEEEPERTPPQKQPEKEAEEKAQQEEDDYDAELDRQETGVGSEVVVEGGIEYHDHTTNVRRPSMRMARRRIPVSQGVDMRYAHRYMLDKGIFSQRLLTEGGLMIDGSGSMNWTNDDMQEIMRLIPAIWVGIYSGFNSFSLGAHRTGRVYARICTIAKHGKFARFDGLDAGHNDGNECDFEALQLLAKWPAPRFWLSDGMVCGGKHSGPPQHHERVGRMTYGDGRIHELCSAWMKRHNILRIPDKETLFKLLKRQRVTLYRTTRPATGHPMWDPVYVGSLATYRSWPDTFAPEPTSFHL